MLTLQEIDNLLMLARMELPADEKEKLRKDIDSILGYIDQLKEAATNKGQCVANEGLVNVFRADHSTRTSGEYTQDLLKAAPQSEDGYVKVKKIL